MKKKLILSIIGTVIITAGLFVGLQKVGACAFWWGCSLGNQITYLNEQAAIEQNQQRLDNIEPLPKMTDSLERKNLIKRAQTFNNPNKISYIYLYSFGKLIMYDTVKGKVSALNSSLTSSQQFVDSGGKQIGDSNSCIGSTDNCYQLNAPSVDGSYGTNGQGIFYYNENGAYREWNGQYILSDQPFNLTNQPDLVKEVK
ncbi:MAG TPA: hypothetical protein VGL94_02730 [Ktedonobacteraceae bacterium]